MRQVNFLIKAVFLLLSFFRYTEKDIFSIWLAENGIEKAM